MNVTIKFTVPRQRLLDILTTAVESGIGYWANEDDFKNVDAHRNSDGYVYSIVIERARGAKVPKFAPQVQATGNRAVLTLADFADAFGRALNMQHDGQQSNIMVPVNKAAYDAAAAELHGDYDAFTADVLVQFALFGEVVYG